MINPESYIDEIEDLKKQIEMLKEENQHFKNQSNLVIFENTPFGILQSLAETIYNTENECCIWKNSPLRLLNQLKNDCSGKTGELLIESLCKNGDIPYIYNGNVNSTDGTYDILIKNKKIEIKTAKLGKHKGFQHECLRVDGYDYLLFLDICPTYYYITILPKFDLIPLKIYNGTPVGRNYKSSAVLPLVD
jgi:sugar-specific transcriptional regulator TrmB